MKIIQKTNKEDLKKFLLADVEPEVENELQEKFEVWTEIQQLQERVLVLENRSEAQQKLITELIEKNKKGDAL